MRDHITDGVWKSTESDYKCGVQFTNWAAAEPNNYGGNEDSGAIGTNNGKWLDVSSHWERHFLCQLFE